MLGVGEICRREFFSSLFRAVKFYSMYLYACGMESGRELKTCVSTEPIKGEKERKSRKERRKAFSREGGKNKIEKK